MVKAIELKAKSIARIYKFLCGSEQNSGSMDKSFLIFVTPKMRLVLINQIP